MYDEDYNDKGNENDGDQGDNVNCQVDTKELFPDECLIHEVGAREIEVNGKKLTGDFFRIARILTSAILKSWSAMTLAHLQVSTITSGGQAKANLWMKKSIQRSGPGGLAELMIRFDHIFVRHNHNGL